MPLYDETTTDGYGELNGTNGHDYLNRAADAATETMLWADATNSATGESEDISTEYAPVSHDDVPGNDTREQLEGLLQDERVAEIIERHRITPESFGHDFQLTRNGHGTVFWDRGYGDGGAYLTDMTKPSGSAGAKFTRDDDGDITELRFHS
jgi:hypothetical protein